MAKFSRISKLSKQEQEELITELCQALATIKNPQEAAKFLLDLLGTQEMEMLAKRLKLAKLLLDGWKYPEIRRQLRVSDGTIARVNLWLKMSGEGYRLIAGRTKEKKEDPYCKLVKQELKRYMHRYATYYWPFLLWDEVMAKLSQRQKEKFQAILARSEDKRKIYQEFDLLLRETYTEKPPLYQKLLSEKLTTERVKSEKVSVKLNPQKSNR